MMNRMILSIIILSLICGCHVANQLSEDSLSLKQYQFSQIEQLMANENRLIAVFLYAEWCQFCKNMEQTTFKDKQVIELLNNQYYFISFDGESKKDITFNGHIFGFQPIGNGVGTHELAQSLGAIDGELNYPTFVLLNSAQEIVFQHNSYINQKEMANILLAANEGH